MSRIYKIGLIGLGRWGCKIWDTLQTLPNTKVVSVCRRQNTRPDFISSDCKLFTNYQEMLQYHDIHGKLDGLVIAASPFTNTEMILASNDRDLPVMVEKPVVISPAELLDLKDVSIPILVGYQHLYAPAFRKMQEMSKRWSASRLVFQNEGLVCRRNFSSLMDYGSHDLAMAFSLLSGEVKIENCKYMPTFNNEGDIWRIVLTIGSVPVVGHIVNGSYRKHRCFEVENDEQYLTYDAFAEKKLVFAEYRNKEHPIEVDPTLPLTAAVQTFLSMIDGSPDPQKSWEITPKIVKTLNKIAEMQT
jgi:predicted dehydrogenase